MKIDVEGFEPQVISGLGTRLHDCEHIIFEQLPEDGRKAGQRLEAEGFKLMTLEGQTLAGEASLPEENVWAKRIR